MPCGYSITPVFPYFVRYAKYQYHSHKLSQSLKLQSSGSNPARKSHSHTTESMGCPHGSSLRQLFETSANQEKLLDRWHPIFKETHLKDKLLELIQTLKPDFKDVDLKKIDFRYLEDVLNEVDLTRVNLKGSILSGMDLTKTKNLKCAILKNADLQGSELGNLDLSNADLTGAKLQNANLRGTQMSGAKLLGANFEGATLDRRSLEGLDLQSIDLKGVDLRGVDLRGLDLAGAHLENANLEGANLEGVCLKGAHLKGANLKKTNLKNATLEKADLEDSDVTGSQLEGACLKEVRLKGANLQGLNLDHFDLEHTNLEDANLYQASLKGTNLKGAHLVNATLKEVDLTQSIFDCKTNMSGAQLSNSDLSGLNLSQINLRNAKLYKAHLCGTNLSNAILKGACLTHANLTGAHLNNSDLSEADLSGAILIDADLNSANLTKTTLNQASINGANLQGITPKDIDLKKCHFNWVRLKPSDAHNKKLYQSVFKAGKDKHHEVKAYGSIILSLPKNPDAQDIDVIFNHINNNEEGSAFNQIACSSTMSREEKLEILSYMLSWASNKSADLKPHMPAISKSLVDFVDLNDKNSPITSFFHSHMLPFYVNQSKLGPVSLSDEEKTCYWSWVMKQDKKNFADAQDFIFQIYASLDEGQRKASYPILSEKFSSSQKEAVKLFADYIGLDTHDCIPMKSKDGKRIMVMSTEAFDNICMDDEEDRFAQAVVYSRKKHHQALEQEENTGDNAHRWHTVGMGFGFISEVYKSLSNAPTIPRLISGMGFQDIDKATILKAIKSSELRVDGDKRIDSASQIRLGETLSKFYALGNKTGRQNGWVDQTVNATEQLKNLIKKHFPEHIKNQQQQGMLYLSLGAFFAKLSSSYFLGTEYQSPESIRYLSAACLSKARECAPNLISSSRLKGWSDALLGLNEAFTCTAVVSSEIKSFIYDKTPNHIDMFKSIYPMNW